MQFQDSPLHQWIPLMQAAPAHTLEILLSPLALAEDLRSVQTCPHQVVQGLRMAHILPMAHTRLLGVDYLSLPFLN